jgi:hypothetical protein
MAEQLLGLQEHLGAERVSVSAMFGKPALKDHHGKAFACLKDDLLAFRLGDGTPDHQAALALAGASLFDPSGKDRPFKDWVAVPVKHADEWPRLARIALDSLTS